MVDELLSDDRFLEFVSRRFDLIAANSTLEEMAENALFYFANDISYEEKAAKKFLKPAVLEALGLLIDQFEILDDFSEENLESAFKAVINQTGLKLGKIAQPVRVALTGKTASPGIFEVSAILGKDKVISRLQKAMCLHQNLSHFPGKASLETLTTGICNRQDSTTRYQPV